MFLFRVKRKFHGNQMIVLQNHMVRLVLWLIFFGFHVVRSHVWGHFCLSYADQQLINDKACLQNFGIKDGDQVCVTIIIIIIIFKCFS
jgi:hypothetical protein